MLYYINRKEDNHAWHEVHQSSCSRLPQIPNKERLGEFSSDSSAMAAAKMRYGSSVDGCHYCMRAYSKD